MVTELPSSVKFEELDLKDKVGFILKERTPSAEEVIFEPTVEFLDPESALSREERARVVAMGDRTAISYRNLEKKVLDERVMAQTTEVTDKTASFFQMYALAARSSREIAHTSILEQSGVGPGVFGGDPPIVMEGISILSSLRDICSQRHAGFEAFSSRGGVFPENYWRVPAELKETPVGAELEAINREVHRVYMDLTQEGIGYYLQNTEKLEGESSWKYRWRVLNMALDDAREVTNGSFLNHLSFHPNSALAVRETIIALTSSPLPETVEIGNKLREMAREGLPTILKYTEPSVYTQNLNVVRQKIVDEMKVPKTRSLRGMEEEPSFIVAVTNPQAEKVFLAAFLAQAKDVSFRSASSLVKHLSPSELEKIFDEIFSGITLHDKPPRELEMMQITAVFRLSVGAIYELIRHRPMTHIVSDFSVNHGFSIPHAFKENGLEKDYKYGISLNERAVDLIADLGPSYSVFEPYFVSRGHIEPVTIRMSGLDVFHFLKIRASDAAHPGIRGPALALENFLRNQNGSLFSHLVKK